MKLKKFLGAIITFVIATNGVVNAQAVNTNQPPLAEELSKTVIKKWPFPIENESRQLKWTYETGVFLEGVASVWKATGKGEYFDYIQRCMDSFVGEDGSIKTYKFQDFNIDNIKTGRSLLLLYKVTGKEKYFKAAQNLRNQLEEHPRTKDGISFWHKKIYPNQVWLDGLYMGMPFYTEWAHMFNETAVFDNVVEQFQHVEKYARDSKTGLIYHAWDESKEQLWANKENGRSAHFWGRAMGWYGMALIDVLDELPADYAKRKELVAILNRFAESITKVQDAKTGLWYQILDMPTRERNYVEASASSMFVYALAKGVRLGYLPKKYEAVAQKAYEGIKEEFIVKGDDGFYHLNGTVSVAGLGGKPYRDGSYDYYMSEKVVQDDPKGLGAFIVAANEMEIRNIAQVGTSKNVVLDNFFNNEFRKNIKGQTESFHYVWNELDNNGFSLFGEQFTKRGATINTLKSAPTVANLKNASIYIIVDPDTQKETANPNYMDSKSVTELQKWVKKGGVLVLMANDYNNCELDKFNSLANAFGIEFKKEMKNAVKGREYEMGVVTVEEGNQVFKTARKLYLKEISTLNVNAPAKPLIVNNNDVIMATAKYGKGTVFAVGDPWLYNEYIDGRKLPTSFQNFTATQELANWLLIQARKK